MKGRILCLSLLIVFLFCGFSAAELLPGVYTLENGTAKTTHGVNPWPSFIGCVTEMKSTGLQWRAYDAKWHKEPTFISSWSSGDYNYYRFTQDYENGIFTFNFAGKTYTTTLNSTFGWVVVNDSAGNHIDDAEMAGTGTAFVKEGTKQYRIDLAFEADETNYVRGVVYESDITSVTMTISEIPAGLEEGTFALEDGTYYCPIRGYYPSYIDSTASYAGNTNQWSASGVRNAGSTPYPGIVPGDNRTVSGGYIYETFKYNVDISGVNLTLGGKTYSFESGSGHAFYTMVFNQSPYYYTGQLVNMSGTLTGIIKEYDMEYQATITSQFTRTNGGVAADGYYYHSGTINNVSLNLVALTPKPVAVNDPDLEPGNNLDTGLEIPDGDLKGAKIIFDADEPVPPNFGSTDNIQVFEASNSSPVGEGLNLLPHGVDFVTPVKILIPCPGYADVSGLSVYHFDGTSWQLAVNPDGSLAVPGGTDWYVAGSRVNHNNGDPSTIEIKVEHFSAAQAAAPKAPELVVDFGANGLWGWNDDSWQQITTFDARNMQAWSNGLAVDLSPYGLFNYNGTSWDSQMTSLTTDEMASWENGLAVDFGTYGLFTHNGLAWTLLTGLNAEGLNGWSGGLASDFGAYGLFNFNGIAWQQITTLSPEGMASWTNGLGVDFGSVGLFTYSQTGWVLLTTYNPEKVIGVGNNLAVDLGANGLWLYNAGTGWAKISNSNPENLSVWGDLLVVDFGTSGILTYDGSSWTQITGFNPASMNQYKSGLAVDLGPGVGFFRFDGSAWSKIADWNPSKCMEVNFQP